MKSPVSDRVRAKRSLGQNFLIDGNVADKIVSSLGDIQDRKVLEIGPGHGALTSRLLARGARPFVLELDQDLAIGLKRKWPEIEVIVGDAKTFFHGRMKNREIDLLIGNLPYNVASVILWNLAAEASDFARGVFMVQKEVAERIVSPPGSKRYGKLSVWIQSFLHARLLFDVSPNVFRPRPKVWSAVIELEPRGAPLVTGCSPRDLNQLISLSFQKRRKQIGTILKDVRSPALESWFDHTGHEWRQRPEEFTPRDFQKLAKIIAENRLTT